MANDNSINRLKRISGFLGFTVLLLGAMNQPSYALQLHSYPDFKVGSVQVDYLANNSSNNFSALGVAEKFKYGSGSLDIIDPLPVNSFFDLFATISSTGSLAGGTLSLYQDLDSSNSYTTGDNLYLSGNLTGLVATLTDPVLNFLFTPTGGTYVSAYGSVGGIILGASGFDTAVGGFGDPFGTTSGSADVGTPVPEPATVSLFLLGAGGLCLLRRRK